MKTLIQPYLFFGGRCEEAVDFYKSSLGAEVEMLMKFRDSPDPPPEEMRFPGYEDKVMHASFRIGESVVMASDGCGSEQTEFSGFSLSLTMPDETGAKRVFGLLADGGEVQMPLGKTFWSPCFGMVTDRFGLGWMVSVEAETES